MILKKAFACIVLCIFIIFPGFGLFYYGGIGTFSKPNTCGGETMSQGDTCIHFTDFKQTGTSDYNQQTQNNHIFGIFGIIIGAFLMIFGIFGIWAICQDKIPNSRL